MVNADQMVVFIVCFSEIEFFIFPKNCRFFKVLLTTVFFTCFVFGSIDVLPRVVALMNVRNNLKELLMQVVL